VVEVARLTCSLRPCEHSGIESIEYRTVLTVMLVGLGFVLASRMGIVHNTRTRVPYGSTRDNKKPTSASGMMLIFACYRT
jgi:hypothetical protein